MFLNTFLIRFPMQITDFYLTNVPANIYNPGVKVLAQPFYFSPR